jgi:hypothetical protein
MNVQEMHIEVNQSTQQVAANASRKFYAEEIDWVLNKMVNRYIQQKLNQPMSQDRRAVQEYRHDSLDMDGLRNLFVPGKVLQPYVDTATRTFTILPADYLHHVENGSVTVDICKVAATSTAAPVTLTKLKLSKSTGTTAPYFATMVLVVGGNTINLPGDLPQSASYVGFQKKTDVFFLQSFVVTELRKKGLEVYWERYGDTYEQDCLLIVGAHTVSLTVDGNLITSTTQIVKAFTKNTHADKGITVANRLVWDASIAQQTTPYYKTHRRSPLSELSSDVLYTYKDANFIVTSTILSYIRKPKAISLSLDSDCELDEAFHNTICDLATEYINNRVENGQGFNLTKSDIESRVNL